MMVLLSFLENRIKFYFFQEYGFIKIFLLFYFFILRDRKGEGERHWYESETWIGCLSIGT